MRLAITAVIAMILVLVATACAASDKLVRIPYDPQTDLPKLAGNLEITPENVRFHSRCAYIHLSEWAESAKLKSVATCVVALTKDRLVVVTWNEENDKYTPVFSLSYGDISQAALSVEGTKFQLQITAPIGFLAITTAKYRAPPPGDSSATAEMLEQLREKGVPIADAQGRVELKTPKQFIIFYFRRY